MDRVILKRRRGTTVTVPTLPWGRSEGELWACGAGGTGGGRVRRGQEPAGIGRVQITSGGHQILGDAEVSVVVSLNKVQPCMSHAVTI